MIITHKSHQLRFLNWWLLLLVMQQFCFNTICNLGADARRLNEQGHNLANHLFEQYHVEPNRFSNKYKRFFRHRKQKNLYLQSGNKHDHNLKNKSRVNKPHNEYAIEKERPVVVEKCHLIPRPDQVKFKKLFLY